MSKISVITPAYNAADYIAETIQSVQAQTFTDWEMVIVDDCSADATYQVACSYAEADSRIRVIRHAKNSGVAAARNTALDAATGDYVAFLDSDDLWMADKLEKQYRYMEENGYVLTYTPYRPFTADQPEGKKVVKVPDVMTYQRIFGNTAIACLTVMVNRQKAGPFHMPPLTHTEDQCTWQEILSRGYKAYALQDPLALYRESSDSLTGNKKKALKKQWSTYRNYHKFSVLKSGFYFVCYAINAIKKHLG